MFRIEQHGNQWRVLDRNGDQVGGDHASYDDALAAISAAISEQLATTVGTEGSATGVLEERWHSTTGVAFSEPTGDGRDFSECSWSNRDPAVYPLPLMDQTATEIGHFGAQLAGFADQVEIRDGTVFMSGGFYDSDAGVNLRDRMRANRQGVSVDPGDVDAEFTCTEWDDDGWCTDGDMVFMSYEVIGLTATPFPAFANATVELEGAAAAPAPAQADNADDEGDDATDDEAVAASAQRVEAMYERAVVAAAGEPRFPLEPPAAWFAEPEPDLGDPRLIEQPDGSLAVPLTITDDGQVYGHVARWGQCHVGYPQGPNVCTEPPESSDTYPEFHIGHVQCDDGTDVPTGVLVAGCDHPSVRLSAPQARDHYAHQGAAWADVVATNGQFGPWVCGALRPDVTDLQVRVLRASALSGDWRPIDGRNEMITATAVNVPGFPITRRALVASGLQIARPQTQARVVNGEVLGIVAAGIVQPCPECARRAVTASGRPGGATLDDVLAELADQRTVLDRLERRDRQRTRHLDAGTAAQLRTRLQR